MGLKIRRGGGGGPVGGGGGRPGGLPVACSVEAGTEALVKAEAILANLEQRFKKDQIYVSFISLYLHSSLEHTCWLRFPKGGEGFLRSIAV